MASKGRTQKASRLNVKLVAGVDEERSQELFSDTPGFRAAVRLFPDEQEEEMRSLYVVEVSPSEVERAVEKLRSDPAVEYAVAPTPRKLIK